MKKTPPKQKNQVETKTENLHYAIGLDLSFKSSGLVIYSFRTNHWYCYSFAKHVREINAFLRTSIATVELFPPYPKTCTDAEQYEHTCKYIMEALCNCIPEVYRSRNYTKGFIEHYVFHSNANLRGNNYKIQENGGIIKHALQINGFNGMDVMVNTKWKAQVIGNGKASKLDTVQFIAQHGPCVNMLHFCGYRKEDELLVDKKGQKVVPNPCQDLADAAALCMAVFFTHPSRLKPKEKKQPKNKKKTQQKDDSQQEEIIVIDDDDDDNSFDSTSIFLSKPKKSVVVSNSSKKTSFWSSSSSSNVSLVSSSNHPEEKITSKQMPAKTLEKSSFQVQLSSKNLTKKIPKLKKTKIIPMQCDTTAVINDDNGNEYKQKNVTNSKKDVIKQYMTTCRNANNKSKDNMLLQKRPLLQIMTNKQSCLTSGSLFLPKKQKTSQPLLQF